MTAVTLPITEHGQGDEFASATQVAMAQVLNAVLPVGVLFDFFGLSSQVAGGMLACDGETVGDASSNATARANADMEALFEHLWTIGDTTGNLPIYTSAGAVSSYGANAAADWAAHKQIELPDTRNLVLGGASTGTKEWLITAVTDATNQLTVPENSALRTGQEVVFNDNGGTAPTGLTDAATYYVIRVSATEIKLASTRELAAAGTAVNFTTTGSGSFSLTYTPTASTVGEVGGEEDHVLTTAELPAHAHTSPVHTNTSGGDSNSILRTQIDNDGAKVADLSTSSVGGGAAHSNMQPTLYVTKIIWTGATW